jgi:hypothetical protein
MSELRQIGRQFRGVVALERVKSRGYVPPRRPDRIDPSSQGWGRKPLSFAGPHIPGKGRPPSAA